MRNISPHKEGRFIERFIIYICHYSDCCTFNKFFQVLVQVNSCSGVLCSLGGLLVSIFTDLCKKKKHTFLNYSLHKYHIYIITIIFQVLKSKMCRIHCKKESRCNSRMSCFVYYDFTVFLLSLNLSRGTFLNCVWTEACGSGGNSFFTDKYSVVHWLYRWAPWLPNTCTVRNTIPQMSPHSLYIPPHHQQICNTFRQATEIWGKTLH